MRFILGASLILLPGVAVAQFRGVPEDGYPLTPPVKLPAGVERLNDPRTVFYRLPQTYQQWVPAARVESKDEATGAVSVTSRPARWGIYAASVLSEFNANGDFPWESTFGLNVAHRAKMIPATYDVFNFLSLPEDEDGKLLPILVLDERPIKWLFPPGATLGEVLTVKGPDGKTYVQEVRTRTKGDAMTTWHVKIFRPVADRAEFQRLTGVGYVPARKFMSFRNPEEDEVLAVAGTVEKLPNLPPETVAKLLSRPFRDVTDSNWHPSSDQEFSILPKDYSLGLLKEITPEACANCHKQTQISVRRLIPREPLIQRNPDKVGNIRGSDGIFTWHPFAAKSVLAGADQQNGDVIWLRGWDAQNGIARIVPRGQAPDGRYKLTRYVQASLAPYELPLDRRYHHAGTTKCDCTDKDCDCDKDCKCSHPKPWKPFTDNRTLAAVPPKDEAQPAKAQEMLTLVPPGDGRYRWYRGQAGRLFLIDAQAGTWMGTYDPQTRQYRVINGETLGAVATPPVAVPVEVKK